MRANLAKGSAYVFRRSGTTWTEQAQLRGSDATGGANGGLSVALSGGTALVGAPGQSVNGNADQGAAYFFDDLHLQRQQLTAVGGGGGDQFGTNVAIDGNTAVVGAPLDNVLANNDQGSAYVYVRSGGAWIQQAQLFADDGAANDGFGGSVAISGNTIVVGAAADDSFRGAAYVFVRSGTTWTQQKKLTASDGADPDSDLFGSSVAVSGDRAIVGAFGDNGERGAAYVFVRSGTNWTEEQKLLASDAAPFDQFGTSVAIAGTTALAGAIGDDAARGSVYEFVRSGPTWTQQPKLTAPVAERAAGDNFGRSVAISGSSALIGADGDDVGPNGQQGSAYVFVRFGLTWVQEAQLFASDGAAADRFGHSVAISGNIAVVGRPFDTVASEANRGSANVFVRSGGTWAARQQLLAGNGAASDQFGTSVGLSGDTALVGAPFDGIGTNNDQGSAYVFDLDLFTVTPTSGTTAGGTAVRIVVEGASFVRAPAVTFGGVPATAVTIVDGTTVTAVTPPRSVGSVDALPVAVVVTVSGPLVPQTFTIPEAYLYVDPPDPTFDTDRDIDGDGMTDVSEIAFSLDPRLATDADADPDADGRTNLQEIQAGTHPRGFFTRFFAEGATSPFFGESIALANPGNVPAAVLLRFLKSDGTVPSHFLPVGGMRRATVDAGSVAGLATAEFSTVVESDVQVVADRTMRWDEEGYGSHAETSIPSPASTWFLAEGATHSGFDLFYLIQNANDAPVVVRVRYLLPGGTTRTKSYVVGANRRFNIWVNDEARTDPALAALAATDISAELTVTSGGPVIVERAMYLNAGGLLFGAGHNSAGVTAPATSWFLAEGATGSFFDLFILIANPNPAAAIVEARYLLPDGTTIVKPYTVAGNSRFNIWVDFESPALADTAVSTTITATNGVPVIVERAMWWPGPTPATWFEAHNSPGSTQTGTRWALADGEVLTTGPLTDTFILIANTSTFTGTARVTLLFEDGTAPLSREFPISASSRLNVDVRTDFPAAVGKRFGAIVESLTVVPAQLVVERAMYSNAAGVVWAAGTNTLATRLQ
jgi:hypothetical protein